MSFSDHSRKSNSFAKRSPCAQMDKVLLDTAVCEKSADGRLLPCTPLRDGTFYYGTVLNSTTRTRRVRTSLLSLVAYGDSDRFRGEWESLNIPGQMMNGAGGR